MDYITISTQDLEHLAEKIQLTLDSDIAEALRVSVESWYNGAGQLAQVLATPKLRETAPAVVFTPREEK